MGGLRFDLSGKTAIVTGGGRGLGRTIAVALAQAGADVSIGSRKLENCESAAAEIRGYGRRAVATACHVGKPGEVDRLFDATIAAFGRVDIVFNNAATSPAAHPLVAATSEVFDRVFAINVKGPLQLASRAAAWMGDHGGGVIVNVISVAAFKPGSTIGLYCASKAALYSLTRVMAQEWAPLGVRVNALAPGPVRTDMVKAVEGTGFHDAMVESTLMKRVAAPEELVESALFLASDASSYMTGQALVVDGGVMA
jgi:NAD(P)-dependent dehydrogenase (short-subunit alcohol dehydrogenase family)